MKPKYKLKKSAIIIILIFIISIIALIYLLISLFSKNSYSIEYNLNDFAISENYDATEKLYSYEITYKDLNYNFLYESKHLKNQKLIKDIKTIEKDEYICLLIESEEIETKPLCSENNQLIDINLLSDELKAELSNYIAKPKQIEETYNNYTIYNRENNILIWAYKGFNYIKNNETTFIKLFDKDIYEIPHATKINNYLVIPNYEQEYNFNVVYIIDLETEEIDTWKLDYEISFDSYITGINNRSIYLIDNKNKIEYELVPHKKRMRILATSKKQGIIYKNGIEEKISMNKLASNTIKFTYKNNYHYTIEDNKLYLTYLDDSNKIRVSNQKVSSIVSINKDDVYYLVEENLYHYSLNTGEQKLVSYSEWQFNNQNLIFIK